MENFVEITIEKSGIRGKRNFICFEEEEFGSIKELAKFIANNCADDLRENRIKPSKLKPTISQEEFEELQTLVENLLRDSVEEYYEESTIYA